jgi:hypothetical protein
MSFEARVAARCAIQTQLGESTRRSRREVCAKARQTRRKLMPPLPRMNFGLRGISNDLQAPTGPSGAARFPVPWFRIVLHCFPVDPRERRHVRCALHKVQNLSARAYVFMLVARAPTPGTTVAHCIFIVIYNAGLRFIALRNRLRFWSGLAVSGKLHPHNITNRVFMAPREPNLQEFTGGPDGMAGAEKPTAFIVAAHIGRPVNSSWRVFDNQYTIGNGVVKSLVCSSPKPWRVRLGDSGRRGYSFCATRAWRNGRRNGLEAI